MLLLAIPLVVFLAVAAVRHRSNLSRQLMVAMAIVLVVTLLATVEAIQAGLMADQLGVPGSEAGFFGPWRLFVWLAIAAAYGGLIVRLAWRRKGMMK